MQSDFPSSGCLKYNAITCGFQQCGILTSVDSDEPVQLSLS